MVAIDQFVEFVDLMWTAGQEVMADIGFEFFWTHARFYLINELLAKVNVFVFHTSILIKKGGVVAALSKQNKK